MPALRRAGEASPSTDPTTAGAVLLNRRTRCFLTIRGPGTFLSWRATLWYSAGRYVTSSRKRLPCAARIQPSTSDVSIPVTWLSPAAVACGSLSRYGFTPTTSAVDQTWSGWPAASRTDCRWWVVEITASRRPGPRPGLITLGLQTIFQPGPSRRSQRVPRYIHGAPSWPRSTDAVKWAVAMPRDWLIVPMFR